MYYIFRLLGDITHLLTIIGLLGYIWSKKTSNGISGKTQVLFAVVFITRYTDVIVDMKSDYLCIMKVIYIATTYATVLTIYFKFKNTKAKEYDTFRFEWLEIGALITALFFNYSFEITEVLWAFSEYLEAVAIIPQMYYVSKAGHSENVVNYYIYGLAQYRFFYVINWCYKYYEFEKLDLISTIPGVIQCIIYFFYFFVSFNSKSKNIYEACDVSDPSEQPVFVLSANDLPSKDSKETRGLIEKV